MVTVLLEYTQSISILIITFSQTMLELLGTYHAQNYASIVGRCHIYIEHSYMHAYMYIFMVKVSSVKF